MATTRPDGQETRLPDDQLIEVHPVRSSPTTYDRTVVFFEIEDNKRDQLEEVKEHLTWVIRDLYAGKNKIDHLEFFAWTARGAITCAMAAYSYESVTRKNGDVTNVRTDDGVLEEPLKSLYERLSGEDSTSNNEQLPEWIDPQIGTLPLGVFGEPAVTARGVMTESNQKIAHGQKIAECGLSALFNDLRDEGVLYYAHIRRKGGNGLPENFTYQVTPRVALFHPRHRINNDCEYADVLQYGRTVDPLEKFEKLGVSSSLDRIDDQYNVDRLNWESTIPLTNSSLGLFRREKSFINGDVEYDEIRRGRYGAGDDLERLCAYTSVMTRESDLSQFVRLVGAPSTGDPWKNINGVGPRVDEIETVSREPTFEPVSIRIDEAVPDSAETDLGSVENDGEKPHTDGIKQTAVAFRQLGYKVLIVSQDTGSRPDLWVMDPSGEIFAVEVESTTRTKAASVYTNLVRQAVWGYKTIMVMVPQERKDGRLESAERIAHWAVNAVAKPMKDIDEAKTKLYNLSKDIYQYGKTLLLPDGVTESEWWLTWENHLVLLADDGTVLARGDATAPFSEFEFYTPRLYEEDGRFIVEDEDGTVIQDVADEDLISNTHMSPCHRLVDLSYLNFVEAIFTYDPEEGELTEHDIVADWDQYEKKMKRHNASHNDAFSTFVIDRPDDVRLSESDCRPFIREWIGNLSTEGKPADNMYGQCRKPYVNRKKNGDKKFYPGAAFRYDRGLVSPELPGLSTEPSYPAEWLEEGDSLLREPLIHGLSDRDDIPGGS